MNNKLKLNKNIIKAQYTVFKTKYNLKNKNNDHLNVNKYYNSNK